MMTSPPTDVLPRVQYETQEPYVAPKAAPPTPVLPPAELTVLGQADLVDQTLYLPSSKVALIVCSLTLSFGCGILEQTILAVALPSIGSDFQNGALLSWVVNSFLLGTVAFSPFFARFSDIWGRRTILTICNVIFFLSTIGCAFCSSMVQLIIFRTIQGIGSSGSVALAFVVLSDVCPLSERAKYQSIVESICSASQAIGPLLGGVLVDKVGWRSTFWVLLPIIAIATVLQWLFIPEKTMAGDWRLKLRSIDWTGCAVSLAATVLLLVAISRGGVEVPWTSPQTVVLLVLSVLGFAAFVVWEIRFASLPLIPFKLFKRPTIAALFVATLLFSAANFMILYYLPMWLQIVKGLSGIKSGVTLLPYGVCLSTFVYISTIVANSLGLRPIILIGLALWSIFAGLLTAVNESASIGKLSGFLVLGGIGAGLAVITTMMLMQAAVDRADSAVITGTRNYAKNLGSAIGTAMASTVVLNEVRSRLEHRGLPDQVVQAVLDDGTIIHHPSKLALDVDTVVFVVQSYVEAYRSVFYLITGLLCFCFVICLCTLKDYSLVRDDDEDQKVAAKEWLKQKKEAKSVKSRAQSEKDLEMDTK